MSLRVIIIGDKTYPVESNETIYFTQEEYQEHINPNDQPLIGHEGGLRGVPVFRTSLSEHAPMCALQIEGVELYDLGELSAGQIKNLLKRRCLNKI